MREGHSTTLWGPSPAVAVIGVVFASLVAGATHAQHSDVASTVHNLSASGPGEIRSLDETEVCKFCHIPHTDGAPEQLWSRRLPSTAYRVPRLRAGGRTRISAPQPDGSSRLCLSCHDGTVALGDVVGEPRRIAMTGSGRLSRGRRGFIGSDLSGSHPVSFVVPDGEPIGTDSASDMGLRPLAAIAGDPDVKLDDRGKMQCTTCHDPHSDRHYQPGKVPRFWVKSTVSEVCLTCHAPR